MKQSLKMSLIAMSTASLLLVSTVGFAANYKGENYKGEAMAPAPAPCPYVLALHDGFYVGGQIGYSMAKVGVDSTNSFFTTTPDEITTVTNRDLAADGFMGGLFLGYGMYFNSPMYLGVELNVNDSNADATETYSRANVDRDLVENSSTKVEVNESYGISLLPGWKLNDSTLLYARLGWNRAKVKATHDSSTVDDGTVDVATSASESDWTDGFVYGVGVESAFAENWSLRLEANHTNLSSFTVSSPNTIDTEAETGSSYSARISPEDNQVTLGLVFHFA